MATGSTTSRCASIPESSSSNPTPTTSPCRGTRGCSRTQLVSVPLACCRILDAPTKKTKLLLGFPADGRNYVIHPDNPGAYGLVRPWVESAPASLTGSGVSGVSAIVCDVDNDADPDVVLQAPNGIDWMTLRNPAISFAPTSMIDVDMGPAPPVEGPKARHLDVTVGIPQAVIDANILFAEIGLWVADPDSVDPTDPDYLYWGRLMPPIHVTHKVARFTVFFDEDEASFEKRVRTYKKHKAANIDTFFDVYPKGHWETIRGGPRMFMSMHAVDNSQRFESVNGNEPPKPRGSTLGGKWVLHARPPSLKGDLELLPWE